MKKKLTISRAPIKSVRLDDKVKALAYKKVALSSVGMILASVRVNRESFRALISRIWCVDKGLAVGHIRGNTYAFHFNDERERKRVLNKGHWSFNNSLIVLEKPIGGGKISKMSFNMVSFWV